MYTYSGTWYNYTTHVVSHSCGGSICKRICYSIKFMKELKTNNSQTFIVQTSKQLNEKTTQSLIKPLYIHKMRQRAYIILLLKKKYNFGNVLQLPFGFCIILPRIEAIELDWFCFIIIKYIWRCMYSVGPYLFLIFTSCNFYFILFLPPPTICATINHFSSIFV